MNKAKQAARAVQQALTRMPVYGWILVGSFLLASLCLVHTVPRTIAFSYDAPACTKQLTLFPDVYASTSDDFEVKLQKHLKIGGWAYAATETCVTPKTLLKQGVHPARISPWGVIPASRHYIVKAAAAPTIKDFALEGAKLSATRPLRVPLTSPDVISRYRIATTTSDAPCTAKTAQLSCDIESLELKQGSNYALSLVRSLGERSSKETLLEGSVKTLEPLHSTGSSIQPNQVIYAKQKDFAVIFDQPLAEASVTITDESGKKIPGRAGFDGQEARFTAAEDLPRSKKYTLTVTEAVAKDGRSTDSPVAIPFEMSGGPKVKSVSVGASGVAQSARIVLTFDQPLHESVDVAKVLHVTGVNASVQKLSETQVVVALQSAPLCAAFTLQLDKGVKSGSNDETSTEPWKFDSRVTCGFAQTIGYSVRGRALTAHYFGNGARTALFTGGIHGTEPSSVSTMQAFVNYLYANGNAIPAGWRIVIVPNVNPDGIAINQRYNAHNVNLDRNFPASNWAADIDAAGGRIKNGGGTAPLSEPESRALATLTRQLRPQLAVSFHAQGSLVGSNSVGSADMLAALYARLVGYRSMVGSAEATMGYPITGEYEDWMGEELGIPAILIELPTQGGNYFSSHLAAIQKLLK